MSAIMTDRHASLEQAKNDVLDRAFEYWRLIDADSAKRIEEIVRAGGPNLNPGGQADDAKDESAHTIVESDTHAAT